MFFETIAKFDTFQFICGTPSVDTINLDDQGAGVFVHQMAINCLALSII